MPSVIYDVAVSADGFIAGTGDDISAFPTDADVVGDYFERLKTYDCCLMGRRTYEFGYGFGMKPGENPYPHMQSHVFSRTLDLPEARAVTLHRQSGRDVLAGVIAAAPGPVYLCGGGALAGDMARHGLIDRLILKRAPVFLGRGIRLFGGNDTPQDVEPIDTKTYACGVVLQSFEMKPPQGAD